jgi:hypothetical protein
MTTVDNSVESVDKPDQHQVEEKKGIFIPGAVWPDPKKQNFTTERRDPFAMQDRSAPLKKRRRTDLQDE